ncbi:hypothetical protein IPH25_02640 [bacterium]|nr:MAG: hypothetical protein IPG37_04780 [bacterium]QQR62316.1 MAG: hypothetical protein IPH25_02640 [bacterium]QQR63117.1 MAG: hypothetical protein IPH67_01410 [bacterium]
MNITCRSSWLLLLIFLFLPTNSKATHWILGSVHFDEPTNEKPLIYFEGNTIRVLKNQTAMKYDFELPRHPIDKVYYVLVTESKPIPVSKETAKSEQITNTFAYFKIHQSSPYKLYKLTLQSEFFINPAQKKEEIHYWEVQEEELAQTGRIPDKTIIILQVPDMITRFESGGSLLNIPTLYFKKPSADIKDRLVKMYLSAPDMNTLHIPIKKIFVKDKNKVIVACKS